MNVQVAEPDAKPGPTKPWNNAQKALELIAQYGCLPSPKAYEVFYSYASGDPAVRAQVDKVAGIEQILTSFDLDKIHHENFRTNEGDWETQQLASHRIEAQLGDAAEGLVNHAQIGEAYERTLAEASGQISENRSPEKLSQLVDTLISETGTVRSATASMRSNLLEASNEVGQITTELASSRREASKDLLTGLSGVSGYNVQLLAATDAALKNGLQLLVCVIGVDGIDQVNAAHGRLSGDATIRALGRMIGRFATGNDMVARVGGATFAILMQGCSVREAYTSSTALCSEIAGKTFTLRETNTEVNGITASIGLSALREGDDAEGLMFRARARMKAARGAGGNTVEAGDLQVL